MQMTSLCLLALETRYRRKQAISQFHSSLSQCIKDKSINKQQPDPDATAQHIPLICIMQHTRPTYRDQQSSTRVRQQVHLPGQHHQSPRRCRRYQNTIGSGQHLQIYSCYGDPQYTPKRPNSESTRAISSLCSSTTQNAVA